MLVFDQVRGFDSTGICFVPNRVDDPQVEKVVDGPENLWMYNDSTLLDGRGVAKLTQKVMLGHNRAATIGKVTVDNAHPFTVGNITGVHNGSLDDWCDLEYDENNKQYDVDSQALIATIAKKGIEHTWKSFLGAAALVWWDKSDGSLNFIRNEQRPLHFAYSEKQDVLFWASEPWMILVAAERNGIKLKTFTKEKQVNGQKWTEKYTAYPIATHRHFKFKVTINSIDLVGDKELEKKARPPVVTTNYTVGFTNRGNTTGINQAGSSKINQAWANKLEKAEKHHVGRVFQFERSVESWKNGVWTPYFVGKMVNGEKERIYVYPQTRKQYDDMINENKYYNNFYRTKCRLRISLDLYQKFWSFCISQDNIENTVPDKHVPFNEVIESIEECVEDDPQVVRLYKTFGNRLVEEDEWRQNMKKVGGCCAWCNTGISIQEANSCEYLMDSCILCPECKTEPYVQNYLGATV